MANEPPSPLTVDEYHRLIRAGMLTEDDPVELLEDTLVYKTPKSPPHSATNSMVRASIERVLRTGFHYSSQNPVTLPDGEPEPDGAVVRGRIGDYIARHPGPDEVPLIIEVADTSLDRDRGIKLRSYARAGIAEYWIVNLTDRVVEVHADPDSQATGEPVYRKRRVYGPGDSVPLVIAGARVADVPVSAMLP